MGNAVTFTAADSDPSADPVERRKKECAVVGEPLPTDGSDRYSEERQFVNEVGRLLLALEEKGNGETTDYSSSRSRATAPTPHRDADEDLQTSKSTGSTKGSPDWSLAGGGAGPPETSHQPASVGYRGNAQAQRRSGGIGGGVLGARPRTSPLTSTHGVTFALHPTHSPAGAGTEPATAAPTTTSSSLSRSPFLSRLLFRRAQQQQQQQQGAVPEPERNDPHRSSAAALKSGWAVSPSASGGARGRRSSTAAANPSARIPVGKRRSRHFYDRGYEGDNNDDDDEEAAELQLQQLYDLRTWDLYMRITEARQLKEQEKLQKQQLWSHHIPHAQPYAGPLDEQCHDEHPDTTTEPTSSPDSDYGWYDDYPSPRGRDLTAARAAGFAGTAPSGPGTDHSHELIFGDPEL